MKQQRDTIQRQRGRKTKTNEAYNASGCVDGGVGSKNNGTLRGWMDGWMLVMEEDVTTTTEKQRKK
jgi:hypothetical protein